MEKHHLILSVTDKLSFRLGSFAYVLFYSWSVRVMLAFIYMIPFSFVHVSVHYDITAELCDYDIFMKFIWLLLRRQFLLCVRLYALFIGG